MKANPQHLATLWLLLTIGTACIGQAQDVKNDPLVRMPGTQPDQGVQLEAPNRCLNCHADYDPAAEPGFNWQGSMMAHSARDFLFWSCLTVAAQDAKWAVDSPNATDICLRCHFPKGWLEGRSDPTNGALMTGADYDGVQCDLCHQMWDPLFEMTHIGAGESDDWLGYWDETNASSTPSQPEADITYQEDAALATSIQQFNGEGFFLDDNLPKHPTYSENASGQYFVSPSSEKRASFADAAARHQMLYSRYHKSKYFCSTCHDVSNPILENLESDPTAALPTEQRSAHNYFHVERTFSEFTLSDYGAPGGAAGIGPFANFHITKCQDCHMRDVVGVACNKNGVPIRPVESVEHPQSGQPLHDLTGGNAWVSWVLASTVPASPNYALENDLLLNQGPAALTLDLTQGQGVEPVALLAGAGRAQEQLQLAASIEGLSYNPANGELSFRVQNQTGHKLISGFPEGRRMFVNVKVYSNGELVHQVNPYDGAAGTLKGLSYNYDAVSLPAPQPLLPLDSTTLHGEVYKDALVYEMHPSSALTGEAKTFHFALADGRYKDNRIPPLGFRIGEAGARLCVPVWQGGEDPDHYTAAEYVGGYDEVTLTIPAGAEGIEVKLYYQTTSREYIEFLRNEINGTANQTLPLVAYVAQSDPFFTQLRAWGDTIWDLWRLNKDVAGAKPVLMTQASWGNITPCQPPVPELSATPGNQQVTLSWTGFSSDPSVTGYRVYYDLAGKSQLVAEVPDPGTTTYVDSGLTNGVEYFYKVTSKYAACESDFSNIVSAIPTNQGQTTEPAGVDLIVTGVYVGKGKTRTFEPQIDFLAGDEVAIRAHVVDQAGQPIPDATVDLLIAGPESFTLTSGPSDAGGIAEVIWQTKAPGKRNPGTTPGDYGIDTRGVTATGYHWDGVTTSTSITVQ